MKIDQLLQNNNIEYYESGLDYVIRCLSPEHDDKHPSMRIDKVTGSFNCFSCKYSGNIFIELGAEVPRLNIKVERLLRAIQDILQVREIIIPPGAVPWDKPWRNVSAETMIAFEAFTHSDKEFDNRLCFPIKNIDGKVTNIIARHFSIEAKTKKYTIYPHKSVLTFFPFTADTSTGTLFIVEGIYDMLNLYDKDIKNVICAFGVSLGAKKDKSQKRIIEALIPFKLKGIHTLKIALDGDKAGRDAADNAKKFLSSNFNIETIILPEGKDPGDLSKEEVLKIFK